MSALIELTEPALPASAAETSSPSSTTAPIGAISAIAPLTRGSSGVPLSPTFRPPVIPDVESLAEWDSHLAALSAYYAPEGYAEDAAVFTVAALQWRLNRLARSETDDLAHAIAAAESDAAVLVASRASEPDHIRPVLPTDVPALRRCVKHAKLAAQVIAEFHNWPNHDPIADEHAAVTHYYFAAFYSHSATNPPPDKPPAGWDGTRLRSALTKLAVNRSIYDDVASATAFAQEVAAAERRLSAIDALARQLRRERLVPQSPLATHIRDSAAALSAQLHQAIRQLDLLQARRLGLPIGL